MFRTGAISVRISGKGKKVKKVEIKEIPCRIRNRFRDKMMAQSNLLPITADATKKQEKKPGHKQERRKP